MNTEYVILHIDDDDPEMPGPMFLRSPGGGTTGKLDDAHRFSFAEAATFIGEVESIADEDRVTGVFFPVPDGYKK